MDFLEGIGQFMQDEGIEELEIVDGSCSILLRRAPQKDRVCGDEEDKAFPVVSPLAGILYLAPSGEDAPYSTPGQVKKEGELLFCVEALKHLNEVRAPFDLVVDEILVEHLDSVQEGQVIMLVSRGDRECAT